MTAAIGHLQSKIVACAEPELIGRKIIRVQHTNLPTERWVLDSKAVAYRYVQGTAARLSGAKNQFIDINMDITAEASNQWTRAYIEGYIMPHAIDKIAQSIAKALATHETKQIITLPKHPRPRLRRRRPNRSRKSTHELERYPKTPRRRPLRKLPPKNPSPKHHPAKPTINRHTLHRPRRLPLTRNRPRRGHH
jgi:hypothetical protein